MQLLPNWPSIQSNRSNLSGYPQTVSLSPIARLASSTSRGRGCAQRIPHALRHGLAIFAVGLVSLAAEGFAQVAARAIPNKTELPITAESFCSGMPTIVQVSTKQKASEALRTLCNGTSATNVLRELLANPFQGEAGYRFLREGDGLAVEEFSGTRYVRFNVAFSMRIQGKSAVDLLLAEESLLRDPTYSKGDGDPAMSIQFEVLKPDLRQPLLAENEGDIAFKIRQRTLRTGGRRQFNNLTDHNLTLYRMFDNNFDFMVAIRSLDRDTSGSSDTRNLFNKAIVVRAAITDPKDPKSAIMMTVLNFEIFDQQGQDDAVMSIFSKHVQKDIGKIYSFHQQK